MTLFPPTAYTSVAVTYCQIIVTFLSVTHVERNLREKSLEMCCLCFCCIYAFTFNSDEIADNLTFETGSYCLGLYMVAPLFDSAFCYIM